MHHSRIAIALVVVLATVPGGAAGAVAGEPVLSASLADGTVAPGETTALQLTVVNTGDVEVATPGTGDLARRVTTARGLTVDVGAGDAPISVRTGERAVGTLPEGATPPLQIPIAVEEDATPGTYRVPVELDYTYTERVTNEGVYVETNVTETVHVTLEVTEGAMFEVTSVDTGVRVGATDTVNVTIENVGTSAAGDATVTLSSQNADLTFGRASTASRYVGGWAAGETRTISYEVTAAPTAGAQPSAMSATVAYEDGDGVPTTTDPLSFAVTPGEQVRFPVLAAESNLSVGDSGPVSLTMQNAGPVAVEDATVTVTSTSSALAFGQAATATRFVGDWAPGENRTLVFDVTATSQAEPRSYALRTSVAYEDADGDPGQAPTSAVGVTPRPRQGFAFAAVESDLEVGAEGTLEGTVTNTGETVARNLVVTFAEQPGTVTPLETEAPVGDLGPGETASFSLPMAVDAGAEDGPRQFSLLAAYRNAEGEQRRSESADVRATVAPDDPTFEVTVANATVPAGGRTTVDVTVRNRGDEPVSAVSAKLFATDPLSTTDSEAFVDELAPGATETVTFAVGAGGSALEKTYPVEVDFLYDDADGDTLTSRTYRLAVAVTTAEGGGGLLVPALVVAAVVLVVVGYWALRRSG